MIHVPVKEQAIADPRTGFLNARWRDFFVRLGRVLGTWEAVPYAAGSFTGSGSMTWTVQEADQVTFLYALVGKRLDLAFVIRNAAVGGVVDTTLRIAIPGKDEAGRALVPARDLTAPVLIDDNGTRAIGIATVTAGGSVVQIQKASGANWTAGTNGVEGQLSMEVR